MVFEERKKGLQNLRCKHLRRPRFYISITEEDSEKECIIFIGRKEH